MNAVPKAGVDALERLAAVIASRHPDRGGDPDASYVARLLSRGPDAMLKKIGEEATEVVLAAKDRCADVAGGSPGEASRAHLVGEVADLWFHCMVMLSYFDLDPGDVVRELERREGMSGIEEKALRKAIDREALAKGPGENP